MPTLRLFDVDDTLAHTEVHLKPIFQQRLYQAVRAEGYQGTYEQYHAQSLGFFATHGHSAMGWAEFLGQSAEWTMTTIESISHHLHQPVIDAVEPCPELRRLLADKKAAGDTLAIATHGHTVYATPVLTHLGILGELIPPELLFDFLRTNGQMKNKVETLLWIIAQIEQFTGQKFDRIIFYEDNLPNLAAGRQAKFITIYIKPMAEIKARGIQISSEICDYWYPTIQESLRSSPRAERWVA